MVHVTSFGSAKQTEGFEGPGNPDEAGMTSGEKLDKLEQDKYSGVLSRTTFHARFTLRLILGFYGVCVNQD